MDVPVKGHVTQTSPPVLFLAAFREAATSPCPSSGGLWTVKAAHHPLKPRKSGAQTSLSLLIILSQKQKRLPHAET